MSARRRTNAAWSARFSTLLRQPGKGFAGHPEGVSGTDDEVRSSLWGAERLRFAWRYEGRSATKTFKLPDEIDDALAFRRTLTLAIADDWPADDRGHPIRPGTSSTPTAAGSSSNVIAFGGRPSRPARRGELVEPTPIRRDSKPAPSAGLFSPVPEDRWDDLTEAIRPLEDFDSLCVWRMQDLQSNISKRGRSRAGSTLVNAETELSAAAEFFRYLPGDVRLDASDIEAHSSLRLDDPNGHGLSEEDCLAFVEHRRHLNLATRSQNLRAELNWVREIEAAERASAGTGAPIDLPKPPTLKPEAASVRTIEATCSTVRAALTEAQAEGRIDSNPWTPRVDKRIERPAPTHFSEKQLLSASDVEAITTALEVMKREGRYRNGKREVLTGDRFCGLVELAYGAYLRPEEIRAARRSWLHLDVANPGILVEHAEVNYPLRFTDGHTTLTVVTLKQRNQGETRWVPLSQDQTSALRDHLERFVPEADLTATDPDRQDPRLFTNQDGSALNMRSFREDWFQSALQEALPAPGQDQLRRLSFRHLRHSGITRQLRAGHHIEDVATWAGNSPLVIKTNYRGVIDQIGPPSQPPHPHGAALADQLDALGRELGQLTAEQIEARVKSLVSEHTPELTLIAARALARSAKKHIVEEEI